MVDATRSDVGFRLVSGGTLTLPDGRVLPVGGDKVLVGRHASADLVVDDAHVSGIHCELFAGESGVRLRDLESTNGTFVGPVRVSEADLVAPCSIRVGDTELVFTPDEEPQVDDASGNTRSGFGPLVGASLPMRRLYDVLERVAGTELSVLIMAETGTGKELCARAIHDASPRRNGPLVVVDCGAIPTTLAESILFGHEKGAFTGATHRKAGALLEANGGTLFLDELGELPEEIQPKLLRAVAERVVKRVGASSYEPFDARIVAATRRDLRKEMNANRFREDLFFRLAQVRLDLPPLRERVADIPLLVAAACERLGRKAATPHVERHITPRLATYDWPGNVRELLNVASVLAVLGDDRAVVDGMLPLEKDPDAAGQTKAHAAQGAAASRGGEPLGSAGEPAERFVEAKRHFEELYFRRMLSATGGNISEVSRRCGLARHQVRSHLRKLGLMD